jgi:hypothetical protein
MVTFILQDKTWAFPGNLAKATLAARTPPKGLSASSLEEGACDSG